MISQLKKVFISDETTLDYELSGKIDSYFQFVTIDKVLIARIHINEINSLYLQPKLIAKQNKTKEFPLTWKNSRKVLSSILYCILGLLAPYPFYGIFKEFGGTLYISEIFFVVGLSIHFLFRKFLTETGLLRKKRPLTPEILLFIIAFIYWGIFSTLFPPTMTLERQTDVVKGLLKHGIRDCIVSEASDKTTSFKDAQTFSEGVSFNKFFNIKPVDRNTCFRAQAVPKNKKNKHGLRWIWIGKQVKSQRHVGIRLNLDAKKVILGNRFFLDFYPRIVHTLEIFLAPALKR